MQEDTTGNMPGGMGAGWQRVTKVHTVPAEGEAFRGLSWADVTSVHDHLTSNKSKSRRAQPGSLGSMVDGPRSWTLSHWWDGAHQHSPEDNNPRASPPVQDRAANRHFNFGPGCGKENPKADSV